MAILNIQTVNRSGLELAFADQPAAVGGDSFPNTGAEFLYIAAGATGATLTIAFGINGVVDGQSATNRTVVVAANERFLVGPFPTNFYNDGNGRVVLTYSQVVTITVAALKLTTT